MQWRRLSTKHQNSSRGAHIWLGELDMVDYFYFLWEFKMTRDNSFSHIVLEQSAWSVWALLVAYFISSCTKTILKIWRWFMIVSESFCYFELWQKKIMMAISNKWRNLKSRPFDFLLPFCQQNKCPISANSFHL